MMDCTIVTIYNNARSLIYRKNPGESFFDILPPHIDDTNANYASVCSCVTAEDLKGNTVCGQSPINIPSFLKDKTTAFNLCDRRNERDIHYSDDLTDADYELFKKPNLPENHRRLKRALPNPVVSKENATLYCAQKIAETKVGKLCAEVGVDVQAFVDSCTVDIQVSRLNWIF